MRGRSRKMGANMCFGHGLISFRAVRRDILNVRFELGVAARQRDMKTPVVRSSPCSQKFTPGRVTVLGTVLLAPGANRTGTVLNGSAALARMFSRGLAPPDFRRFFPKKIAGCTAICSHHGPRARPVFRAGSSFRLL